MKKIIFISMVFLCISCSVEPLVTIIQTAIIETESANPTEPLTQESNEILPTNTPAPPPCDDEIPINNDWTTIYCDNFNYSSNWEESSSEDLASSIYQVENGKLVVDFTGKNTQGYLGGVVQWRTFAEALDFTVSIKGIIISKFDNVTWGINFRGQGGNFYSFMISNNGLYWLDMYKNKWVNLITIRGHNAIRWKEENELTIVADGDTFDFYVNGTLINSFSSSSLSGQEISLALYTAEGVTAKFEFDDIVVKQKP